MRVAMWYSNWDMRIEEVPFPQIGFGEQPVKLLAGR